MSGADPTSIGGLLGATIEALNATNVELESRTEELLRLAESLQATKRAGDIQRASLEAVLSSMEDAVFVVTTDGRVTLANRAAERTFGPLGRDLVARSDDGTPLRDQEQPLARLGRGESFEMAFVAHDAEGIARWCEATGRPLRDHAEGAGVLVVRDVSERTIRALQERFIAMAGHELRTPLTAVRGYLEVLRRRLQLDEDDPQRDILDEAIGQADRLGELVDELIEASRLRLGDLAIQPRPTALVALTETAITTAGSLGAGRAIDLHALESEIVVPADARRLEQAVLNLLMNAIQHAPAPDPIGVTIRRERETASIEVADTGPGIAAERLGAIFEPFGGRVASSGDTGLGLGLFIARRIVEAHHGSLTATSEPGHGSVFTIRLPAPARPGRRRPKAA